MNFGSRALAEARYRNRRAEIVDKVRQFTQNGGHVPDDAMLREEMLAVNAWFDEQGRLQLEPKKDINAKLGEGRSTDALDAIALTLALDFPMIVDEGAAERQRERRRRCEEDPYGYRGEQDYDPVFGVVR